MARPPIFRCVKVKAVARRTNLGDAPGSDTRTRNAAGTSAFRPIARIGRHCRREQVRPVLPLCAEMPGNCARQRERADRVVLVQMAQVWFCLAETNATGETPRWRRDDDGTGQSE